MSNTRRVIHVGLGPLGRVIAGELTTRGIGELVAAVDSSDAIAGRTLGELSIPGPGALRVTASLDEAIGSGADVAVVATSSSVEACMDTFRPLLRAGLTVVSTCEELLRPTLRHPDASAELDSIARAHGGRILGTGVNPGFLMDTLAVVTTAICSEVRSVHVLRRQDASSRRLPFQAKIGATLSPQAFADRVNQGTLRHVGLGESLHLIADGLGWTIADWSESIDPILAEQDMDSGLGRIATGHATGVRQVGTGHTRDGRRIVLDFIAAVGAKDPVDRISINGTPSLTLEFPGGVHGDTATCAITLNAIASLERASPGLHTMLTIPPVACRGGHA